MIQNLFIIKNGIALLSQSFGECHLIAQDEQLISSYISALSSITEEITGTAVQSVIFEGLTFHFYREEQDLSVLFILITDIKDKHTKIKNKLQKIAQMFLEKYSNSLKDFFGEISEYQDFKKALIDLHIAKANCGEYIDCSTCPKRGETSEIFSKFKENKKGFLMRIKSFLKK